MRQILLQNSTAFLLQSATVLLQNPTVIIKSDNFITKCNVYYNMRRYIVSKQDEHAQDVH